MPKQRSSKMTAKSPVEPVIAAIGFRVKSGWATAILVAGSPQSPQIIDQRIVELSDPHISESRQPYHAGTGMLEPNPLEISRRTQIVARCADESVDKLLKDCRDKGCKPCSAALVVGSLVDPATITNPHIRAHALEGRLFRTVLGNALRAGGLSCLLVLERRAYAEASAVLGKTEEELKRVVSKLRADQNRPWRADQKIAALVGWMALTRGLK
jgi:hypothetical protein